MAQKPSEMSTEDIGAFITQTVADPVAVSDQLFDTWEEHGLPEFTGLLWAMAHAATGGVQPVEDRVFVVLGPIEDAPVPVQAAARFIACVGNRQYDTTVAVLTPVLVRTDDLAAETVAEIIVTCRRAIMARLADAAGLS